MLMCVISQFWLTKVFFRTDVTFVNGASVVVDWISSQVQDKSMMFNSSQSIPCPEALWICEFESEDDAINHVSTGNHKYAKIQNGIDKALSYFVQQKHILNIRNDSTSPGNLAHSVESANSFCKRYPQGWARKIRKVDLQKSKNNTLKSCCEVFHSRCSNWIHCNI